MIPNKLFSVIKDIIPMIILFIIIAILIKIVTLIYKRKGNFYLEIKGLVYIIYAFILFELVTTTDFTSYSNNFIPFKEMFRYKLSDPLFYRNIVGNIVVFIPLSYIVTDLFKILVNKTNFFITTIFILIISTSIETIQLYIGRTFDIDDIILNFIGGILGFIIYKIIHLIKRSNK